MITKILVAQTRRILAQNLSIVKIEILLIVDLPKCKANAKVEAK